MEDKEKIILDIIKEHLKHIEKFGKEQKDMLDDVRKGDSDIHPNNIEDIKSGLSYSHGYSVGHSELSKKIIKLLNMSVDEINDMLAEEEEIRKENKRYMDNLLERIKNGREDRT